MMPRIRNLLNVVNDSPPPYEEHNSKPGLGVYFYDQNAFIAACNRMSVPEQVALARNGRDCLNLLYGACDADASRSVKVLRQLIIRQPGHAKIPSAQALSERAWARRRPAMALDLVVTGERSAAEFMDRFPRARAQWLELVNRGYVPADYFVRHFVPTRQEAESWLAQGRVSEAECVRLLRHQGPVLRELLAHRHLGVDTLAAVAPPQHDGDAYQAWVEDDLPLPAQLVQAEPHLQETVIALLQSGFISFETFQHSLPRPSVATVRALLSEGTITPWQALVLGGLADSAIEAKVNDGSWKPADIVNAAPISDALASRWIDTGVISEDAYLHGSLQTWHPLDALPAQHGEVAAYERTVELLVTRMALPPKGAARAAYARRMVAAKLENATADTLREQSGTTADADAKAVVKSLWRHTKAWVACATADCVGGASAPTPGQPMHCRICDGMTDVSCKGEATARSAVTPPQGSRMALALREKRRRFLS